MAYTSFYTDQMVEELRKSAPLDRSKADYYADKWQTTRKSIISKCLVEKIEYTNVPPRPTVYRGIPVKADYIKIIEETTGQNYQGLFRCPLKDLETLAKYLKPSG